MSSPLEIAQAIAGKLEPLRDEIGDLQVSAFQHPTPTPPVLDVYPGTPFQTGQGMSPAKTFFYTVRARVSFADYVAGQKVLLQLMDPAGPASVEAALHADQTLDATAESVSVEDDYPTGYQVYDDAQSGSSSLPGVEWRVRVMT